jgi:hypothetical protein
MSDLPQHRVQQVLDKVRLCNSVVVVAMLMDGECVEHNAGAVVPTFQSVLSCAHELGHSLGSGHDCTLSGSSTQACTALEGSVCVPANADGGHYLMYPSVSADDTRANYKHFSTCSLQSIAAVMAVCVACPSHTYTT